MRKTRIRIDIFAYTGSTAAYLLTPLSAYAQSTVVGQLLGSRIPATLNTAISVLILLATAVFLWGVIKYIASAGDTTARTKGKKLMVMGIVGLALMAAAWGVANVLVTYFLIPASGPNVKIPTSF